MSSKEIPFEQILQKARHYKADMTRFLRDMIAIPSESADEKKVVLRIKQEMEKVGFDKVEIDPMGNIIGTIGNGPHLIAMDAHIDTVGVGNMKNWTFDPYQGMEDDEIIGGRGASDQEGGMASMVYAGKIIKDLGLTDAYTLLVTGTVQEEDCDGLCWQYLIEQGKIRPEFVVSTEPTDCRIYRGHRGRMEIRVDVQGRSCHGSAPERGDNAIFKMAPILIELQGLAKNLGDDEFLGKGTLTVSEIFFTSPSPLRGGRQLRRVHRPPADLGRDLGARARRDPRPAGREGGQAPWSRCTTTSGRPIPASSTPPSASSRPGRRPKTTSPCARWRDAYEGLFKSKPVIDKWTFSTNGVSIMGRHGIPVVGFGPGKEPEAHAPNEKTWKEHLVKCAAMYAAVPVTYLQELATPA